MTEDTEDKEDTGDGEANSAAPIAGERLAAIRREKKISVLDVAKELHLDEPKVRALERNEFEVLGAPVFAKGHLKKYAELVDVKIDDIIAEYYTLRRAEAPPPLVGRPHKPVREIRLGRWLLLLLLLALAAGLYWWFVERDVVVRPDPVASGRLRLPSSGKAAVPAPADTDTDSESDTGQITETPEEPPDEIVQQPEPTPVIRDTAPVSSATQGVSQGEGDTRLLLTFSGDCWTEITDADGKRLFFGLGMNGRSVDVTGTAPLSVLLGNAGNVELRVNDLAYQIPAGSRRGNSARFTINAR
jgi:cytoskeleton protein RodZ